MTTTATTEAAKTATMFFVVMNHCGRHIVSSKHKTHRLASNKLRTRGYVDNDGNVASFYVLELPKETKTNTYI